MRNRRNRRTPKKENHSIKILLGVCLFIAFIFLSVIFSVVNMTNSKIVKGVKIEGIDFSGLTQEEAFIKINNWYKDVASKEINMQYEELEESVNPEEFDFQEFKDKAVQKALIVGRSGNILKDNYEILFTLLFSKNIEVEIKYNEEKINNVIDEVSGKLPDALIQTNYYIEDADLIIEKGKAGAVVKKDDLKDLIIKTIKTADKTITIPVEQKDIDQIDIEKIYSEIYREPKDAYIEDNTNKVHGEVKGVDFDISMDEAKLIVLDDKEEYVIPLKITIPEMTLVKLGEKAFPDKLSEYTTRYDASNKNRSNNLNLASEKINGTVVLPGETFSYNKTVGARTISAGYKEAAIYSGGKVINGIGGGICQLSSTLYDAVLYANLEVTSRSNHRFLTSYVQAGRDATVSWGTIDFCFKNTRTYPVKIVTSVLNGIVKVQIWGIKEEVEYDVELTTNILEEYDYKTTYKNDWTMREGAEYVEQAGSNGVKSETYKIVSLDGKVISKKLLSTDKYSSLERVVIKGMKKVDNTTTEQSDNNSQNSTTNNNNGNTETTNNEVVQQELLDGDRLYND